MWFPGSERRWGCGGGIGTNDGRQRGPQNVTGWLEELAEECDEIIYRDGCGAEDCPQSASVQLAVIGNDDLSEGGIAAKNDVATFLTANVKAGLTQRAHTLAAGDAGKFVHTATKRVSNRSAGTGRWSSSRTAT